MNDNRMDHTNHILNLCTDQSMYRSKYHDTLLPHFYQISPFKILMTSQRADGNGDIDNGNLLCISWKPLC